MPTTFENVACTACGCVCDDLRVTVDGGRVVAADGACPKAWPWLASQNTRTPPAALLDGRPASPDDAVARAAGILRAARAPVIYGLSRSDTDGQRAAVALADRLGAVIDTTASLGHAPSVMALQNVGESTCTLGEVKNRADLVVFWGCDPVTSHPRHLERYSADPAGEFVAGRSGRYLVVCDHALNPTAERADLFVPVEPGRHFETLWTLRGLVRGILAGPHGALGELAERMKRCRFGVVFFGLGLSRAGTGHRSVEALLSLVTELNAHTRFYARRLRNVGDVTGADSVLAWQTGYPFAVNLARGYPRYEPAEYSAEGLLARREADAALLVGTETVPRFAPAAAEWLRRIPVVALDHPTVDTAVPAAVRFTTAVPGVHHAGTVYRMDEVPVPLRAVLPADYPTDAEVLGRLLRGLGFQS